MNGVADGLAAPQTFQVEEERLGVGVAGVGGLGERLLDNATHAVAHVRIELPQRRRRLVDVHVGDGQNGVGEERRPAGEEVEQRGRHRVDVGADVHGGARALFRRGVERRADDGPGPGEVERLRFQHVAGQAEVAQLDAGGWWLVVGGWRRRRGRLSTIHQPPITNHHDVFRLHVAVDDAAAVGVGEGAGDVGHHRGGLQLGEPLAPGQHLRQTFTLHKLQYEVGDAAVLVELDQVGDVRVVDLGQQTRLLAHATPRRLVVAPPAAQQLHGHHRPVGDVHGPVNRPHAALAQHLNEPETPDPFRCVRPLPGRGIRQSRGRLGVLRLRRHLSQQRPNRGTIRRVRRQEQRDEVLPRHLHGTRFLLEVADDVLSRAAQRPRPAAQQPVEHHSQTIEIRRGVRRRAARRLRRATGRLELREGGRGRRRADVQAGEVELQGPGVGEANSGGGQPAVSQTQTVRLRQDRTQVASDLKCRRP